MIYELSRWLIAISESSRCVVIKSLSYAIVQNNVNLHEMLTAVITESGFQNRVDGKPVERFKGRKNESMIIII